MSSVQAAKPPPRTEIELVELALTGDSAAFAAIIRQHNRRLYRVVRGIVRNADEAEDIVQETYVRAYAALGRFRGESSLSTWLTRIALNEALGRVRDRRSMVSLEHVTGGDGDREGGEVIPFPLAEPRAADPEHSAARSEIRLVLEQAIGKLPPPFRAVFMMRAVEQMSTEETAACLGIPEETVKTRLHRARRRLRAAVNDQLENSFADAFPFAGARCERIAERVMTRLGLAKPPD